MKIGYEDLSRDVQGVIDMVRSVAADYKSSDGEALVGFNGKNLKIKRRDTKNLTRKCSDADIAEMRQHLFENDEIFESSFHKDYIGSGISIATRLFKNKLHLEPIIKAAEGTTIQIVKEYDNTFIVLTSLGKIGKFDKNTGKLIYQIDILNELQNKFSLQTINIFNIQDIELCEQGLFIATDLYGIFYFNSVKKTLELKFKELYTQKLKYIGDGSLLCLNKNYIALYNLEIEGRIERYMTLANNCQWPKDILKSGEQIFILGKTLSGMGAEKSLYAWNKTGQTVLQNTSSQIASHRDDFRYSAKFIAATSKYVYLFGQFGDRVFTWRYERDNLRLMPSEIIMEVPVNNLLYARVINNMIVYGDESHIYSADEDGRVLENFYVDKTIRNIIADDKNLYIVTDTAVKRADMPKYQKDNHLNITLLDNVVYNNLSMMIFGASSKDDIHITINDENNANSYDIVYLEDGVFVKFTGILNKLMLEMKLDNHTELRGIVLRKDNIY